jgi:hypothetical protein
VVLAEGGLDNAIAARDADAGQDAIIEHLAHLRERPLARD